jgi:hypothetical protein
MCSPLVLLDISPIMKRQNGSCAMRSFRHWFHLSAAKYSQTLGMAKVSYKKNFSTISTYNIQRKMRMRQISGSFRELENAKSKETQQNINLLQGMHLITHLKVHRKELPFDI